jgi:hypothetical protein
MIMPVTVKLRVQQSREMVNFSRTEVRIYPEFMSGIRAVGSQRGRIDEAFAT